MIHPKLKFSRAHFLNDARTTIEAYWTDGKRERVEYIEAKEGDVHYEHLLKFIDIDALHESTYKHIKEQNEAFEDSVIKIAKERGLIYDFDEQNTDVYKAFVQVLFGRFDPKKDKEKLFLYKLQLFEADQVKQSKDTKKKKELRQAKTMIDATKVALSMIE